MAFLKDGRQLFVHPAHGQIGISPAAGRFVDTCIGFQAARVALAIGGDDPGWPLAAATLRELLYADSRLAVEQFPCAWEEDNTASHQPPAPDQPPDCLLLLGRPEPAARPPAAVGKLLPAWRGPGGCGLRRPGIARLARLCRGDAGRAGRGTGQSPDAAGGRAGGAVLVPSAAGRRGAVHGLGRSPRAGLARPRGGDSPLGLRRRATKAVGLGLASTGRRVFYSLLGRPDDFQQPGFLRLLANAVVWAAGLTPP